ncbi:MAG: YadA-like family protein [Alphaproteobacteria bacterium]|nr:YadA-like family protein [Alphaproteobacteria bacterium]MCL2889974.1 YadA-like family protein [Alphaproteobacteria bacterium]
MNKLKISILAATAVFAFNAAHADIATDLANLNQAVVDGFSTINTGMAGLNSELVNTNNELQITNANLTNLSNDVAGLNSELVATNASLETANQALWGPNGNDGIVAQTATNASDIAGLQTQVNQQGTDLANLNQAVVDGFDTLNNGLAGLNSELINTNNELQTTNTNLTNLSNDVAGLNSELVATNASLETANQALWGPNGNDGIVAQVGDIQTDVDSLNSLIKRHPDTNKIHIGEHSFVLDDTTGDMSFFATGTSGPESAINFTLTPTVNGVNVATMDDIGDMSALVGPMNGQTNLVGALNASYEWAESQFGQVNARIDGMDKRVDDISKEMRAGFAGLSAMSALVPNARSSGDTQLSFGTGGYRDQVGFAVGAFHYVNNGTLLNVGGSYADRNVAWRAGVTFGF